MLICKPKNYLLYVLVFILLLTSCSHNATKINNYKLKHGTKININNTNYWFVATSFNEIPNWDHQDFINSLNSFKNSCIKLHNQTQWKNICLKSKNNFNNIQAKYFFEKNFIPWALKLNNHLAKGLITGYYQPIIHGSLEKNSYAYYPVYSIPNDFISVPIDNQHRKKSSVKISITGKNSGIIKSDGKYIANLQDFYLSSSTNYLKGRIEGNYFIPYYSRSQINAGVLNNKAHILAYATDPIDLFFLHIQGSGIIKTEKNYIYLNFADKNGLPFKSIATYMANQGYLPLSQINTKSIKQWLQKNPFKLSEILSQNPSYIFFSAKSSNNLITDNFAIGSLGVPMIAQYSAAVDDKYIKLGSPIFISTTDPKDKSPLNKLIIAQDIGSEIKGIARLDYFLGSGKQAGELANQMKYDVYMWVLVPNGQYPNN